MKAWIKLYNFTGEVLTILILLITLAIIYRSVGLFDCFAFLPELFDPRNWGKPIGGQ